MDCLDNKIPSNSEEPLEKCSSSETCESKKIDRCNFGEAQQEKHEEPLESTEEKIELKIIYNKNKYDVNVSKSLTIAAFKKKLHEIIGVPEAMQKLMYKGLLKDDQTIGSLNLTDGAKIMLVGSKLNDVLAVSSVTKQDILETEKPASSKEPLSKQKMHRKILDKGVPDDAMPGIRNVKEPLPPVPLSGMLNKHGGKVRLTFKLEQDQLWLGTKERTEKLPMTSIKNIVSEPIEGHEEYHIMGIQLGPTEASRYWVYWVPAQYVDAIKDAVLGKWPFF